MLITHLTTDNDDNQLMYISGDSDHPDKLFSRADLRHIIKLHHIYNVCIIADTPVYFERITKALNRFGFTLYIDNDILFGYHYLYKTLNVKD